MDAAEGELAVGWADPGTATAASFPRIVIGIGTEIYIEHQHHHQAAMVNGQRSRLPWKRRMIIALEYQEAEQAAAQLLLRMVHMASTAQVGITTAVTHRLRIPGESPSSMPALPLAHAAVKLDAKHDPLLFLSSGQTSYYFFACDFTG